ncbi:DUF3791 domain-containing protein [Eggerthellaceae bacterium zg-887]|uniref:DUF3791 domain-containing protein n=1 Tax=Xiamenia xianingshaonis TaxID=2682776 RepID=UPI0013EC95C6|nr:DUF3791 domain-containing protein [Xiamenia xianingshaonis]NGM18107.1 DUF3791 domain-containing protein [Eggerthellaceae bacterium zg-893]NHM16545.1 DUF3791 domain-containing protein [Xiamenia xianingshaonis]
MSPRQTDVADMQCWLLRMAQVAWHMPAKDVAMLFRDQGVFDYIDDLYGLLHVSSYQSALGDVEKYLQARGALPC